ncbi:MAG: hypothetical protein SV765_11340 [Pseudomonadota bacterium]|nr:hypothetical protein [Pseudomonadota bacterium]
MSVFRTWRLGVLACLTVLSGATDATVPFTLSSLEQDANWLDTQPNNGLSEDPSLFESVVFDGEEVLRATSTAVNIHSHYQGTVPDDVACEYSGRMYSGAASPNKGVTFASDYPNADAYYRLRTYNGGTFQLSFHPYYTKPAPQGNLDTGVTAATHTWYRFRIQWGEDAGATRIRAKVWVDGAEPEPEFWQIGATDSDASRFAGCKVGVWSMNSDGQQYWDDLGLTEIDPQWGATGDAGEGIEANPHLWFDTYLEPAHKVTGSRCAVPVLAAGIHVATTFKHAS